MKIVFASSNPHKLREVHPVLGALRIELVALASLKLQLPEPVEDGASFEENARIKAIAYAKATGLSCLAEDSGLEVDALGGAPGVHSARYAGLGEGRLERDDANNAKLLDAMRDVADGARAARFVCAMCLSDPEGNVLCESRGTYEGVIAREPRGRGGFGYDPLLLLPDGRTSAELSPEEKNARSHRGAAARAMALRLADLRAAEIEPALPRPR